MVQPIKMTREPIPTWFFALVVVRHEGRYLLVHETKHGQKWYLPAGRVEPGESLLCAARRETMEEAGIKPRLDGIVRFEHQATLRRSRLRVVFAAVPEGSTKPKAFADQHSLEAGWFTLEEMRQLDLRGSEVIEFCAYLERGGAIASLDLLSAEGAPLE